MLVEGCGSAQAPATLRQAQDDWLNSFWIDSKIERAEACDSRQPDGFDLKLGNMTNVIEERTYLRL